MPTIQQMIEKMLPVRAEHKLCRGMVDKIQQLFKSQVGTSVGDHLTDEVFRKISQWQPLNYGYTYVGDNIYAGNSTFTKNISIWENFSVLQQNRFATPYTSCIGANYEMSPATNNANETCKNIAGYLTFETVGEFCDRLNYSVVSPIYCGTTGALFNDNWARQFVKCDSNGNFDNRINEYRDYIIPYITWYVGDSENRTEIDYTAHKIGIYYIISFNAIDIAKYANVSMGGGTMQFITQLKNLGQTVHVLFSLPYCNTAEKIRIQNDKYIYRTRNMTGCGSLTTEYAGNGNYNLGNITNSYLPFVSLTIPQDLYLPQYNINKIGGSYFYGGEAPIEQIIAYKSVDDFKKLFSDAGIFISENIDDVYNYSGNTDIIINPDPTDKLEYFPDNSSDTTPIENGYITTSSFGAQLIYNPINAKNFIKWVGDSGVNIDNWRRLFANPVDVITSIKMYNLDLVSHDSDHVTHNDNTNILGVVNSELPNYSIDIGYNNIISGGTLFLSAYYGNYADFTSMTYQIFIPFVGFATLRACDVVNTILNLKYAVDFSTGSAVAFLTANEKLIYTAPCNVAGDIPLTISDRFSQEINNSIIALKTAGGAILGAATKNPSQIMGAAENLGGLQLQTHYTNRGAISSINAYKLLPAFVERTRYDLFLPSDEQQYLGANYQTYSGAPSTQFDTIVNCADSNGYVESDVVYITSETATAAEKDEIINLIKTGIYL